MGDENRNPIGHCSRPLERETSRRWRRLSCALLCAAGIDLGVVMMRGGDGAIPTLLRLDLATCRIPRRYLGGVYAGPNSNLEAHWYDSDYWTQIGGKADGQHPNGFEQVAEFVIYPKHESVGLFVRWNTTTNWVRYDQESLAELPRTELKNALDRFIDEVEVSVGGPIYTTLAWRHAQRSDSPVWVDWHWAGITHDLLAAGIWILAFVGLLLARYERAYERWYNVYVRPVCPSCGYPRSGLPSATCPECGFTARPDAGCSPE